MHDPSVPAWPPTGVTIAARHRAPGPVLLAPAGEHRIMVHASPATRSACRETGQQHLRRLGDIDIVPAGEAGGFDAEAAHDALEICLARGVLDRVAAEVGRAGVRLETRHLLRNERIVHLAQALDGDRRAGSPGGVLFADSIGVALATQLLGPAPVRPGRLSGAQLRRVLAYIDAHLDQPLTLAALSREAGASSAHLRTWFKVATGLTVHRYVMRRRVERARALLRPDGPSITEVALATGFAHPSHLARWMRRELGLAPGQVRLRRA